MQTASDEELLGRYVSGGADEAFTELVHRHFGLVWSAARRISGNAEAARDVAQTVFADLARKARTLPEQTLVAGWLYRAACHAAAKHSRTEIRRANREKWAMESDPNRGDFPASPETSPECADLQPLLDAALEELSDTDRDAVVLRYLSGRSLAEVGAALGASEDAAQKRVSRALDRLRESFQRRGVRLSDGVLAAALTAAASQSVPVGLAAPVAAAALAGVGATPGILSLISAVNTKLILGTVGSLVAGAALIYQHREVRHLEALNADLRQQVGELQRTAPVAVAAPSPPMDTSELQAELLRLRGELAGLRQRLGADWARRAQAAESRAAAAEAEAENLKATEDARAHTVNMINALKYIGLAAHAFASSHEDHIPRSFDEMRAELDLPEDNLYSGGIGLDLFEFFPHEREVKKLEPSLILFREKSARQLPDGTWERIYCLGDGSVQTLHNQDGDFSVFEREGTGTAANAPGAATAGN